MESTSGIVESTHESWSQLVESRSRRIPSYYVILKNGHFQNRLHDSTVKIEPASDSMVLCNMGVKWKQKIKSRLVKKKAWEMQTKESPEAKAEPMTKAFSQGII